MLERVGYYCRRCKWCGESRGWAGRECDQTRAEESRRSHMHRDDDNDTIWSFAPEACDNITATCYVPHGRRRRHAWELLTPTRRNATRATRAGRQRLHTCQGEGWFMWVGAHIVGRKDKEKGKGAAYPEVADRRVLGRIFCIWICRICQIFRRRCLPTIVLFPSPECYQHSRSPLPPDSLCLSFVRSSEVHAEHFWKDLAEFRVDKLLPE